MKRPNCKTCLNDRCFIKISCEKAQLSWLNERMSIHSFKKGQQFIYEETPVTGIHFILKGKVKISKSSINGRHQIVRLTKSGDIIGHRGYGGDNLYPISATALEDVDLCFIAKDIFLEALKNIPELTLNLMMFYAEELNKSEIRMKNMAQMSVKQRVAEALLYINDTFGGNKRLNVNLKRKEIAEIAGTNEEQVIRVLSGFKEDGIIKTEGKSILILKPSKLIGLMAGN